VSFTQPKRDDHREVSYVQSTQFGVHEVVDLREVVNFKAACLTEAKERATRVKNPELKALVEQSIQQGTMSLKKMNAILTQSAGQIEQ
jgi:similar to spore coat protein